MEKKGGLLLEKCGFDANGNRVSNGEVCDAQERLTETPTATYTYTANGSSRRGPRLGPALGDSPVSMRPSGPGHADFRPCGPNARQSVKSSGWEVPWWSVPCPPIDRPSSLSTG